MNSIRSKIKESRSLEVIESLERSISSLNEEGLVVEFGKIGDRTTWALIRDNKDIEIVGYTYLSDMKYYDENVGKLKALQQALARKYVAEEKRNI